MYVYAALLHKKIRKCVNETFFFRFKTYLTNTSFLKKEYIDV